ncbi:MAG: DEAD/DEAH box helicase family protein [Acidobacteria bacterium]|nr:DEAD/DEAH box helicase family protein [Acidobacteriota bacterium]
MTDETKIDFRFACDEQLELGGAAARFKHNVAALQLLKRLETGMDSERDLAEEEQRSLARYSGWGDTDVLNHAFPNGTYSWAKPHAELEGLLTPEETSSLLASSLNAHYTSLPMIRAIYAALAHFGLAQDRQSRLLELEANQSVAFASVSSQKLRVLEPAAGIGHWLGAMPADWRAKTERVAVEIDSLSGRILTHLYPNTKAFIQPFEAAPLPENYFDLILSNVPFGNYAVADGSVRENYLKAAIHDYFFVKALRLLRPGGVIAFITSRYTLDKQSPKVRQYLAQHAELLAAARLPRNAFRANAGTEVMTDVVLLRKRRQACREVNEAWVETSNAALRNAEGEELELKLNHYYTQYPAYLLGTPTFGRGMYQANEFLLQDDGRNLAASLAECLCAQLPAQGYQATTTLETPSAISLTSPSEAWINAAEIALLSERERNCVTELRAIYTAAKEVIALQLRDASDEDLQAQQQTLTDLYTRFKAQFGSLHQNLRHLNPHSPAVPFLKALEIPVGKNLFNRAPLFYQRTMRPARQAQAHCTPKEALLICLQELGRVDVPYIARQCQRSLTEVVTALDGLIYETPAGSYETAEEYLSGEVRQKLREAERAAACNPAFTKHVAALQAIQPANLGPDEIIVRLGAGWVPEPIVQEFVTTLVPSFGGTVRYLPTLATWKVENISAWARSAIEANQTWGTSRANAFELIEDILNLRTTTITDESIGADGSPRRVVNDNETIAAQAKQLEIKRKFSDWIWQDEARTARLIQIYNERFNAFRKREFDGSHLSLPGMSTAIELFAHQKNSIWRILQSQATLLAHCVGAGKTFVMLAAAMELKRLGLCHKALIVVPNHLPAQWAAEALRLYPNIRLLAPSKEHLTSAQRGELLSRIATSDYDAIIIPQTAFKMLPLNPTTVRDHIQREMETLNGYLEEFESTSRQNKRSIKEIQRALKKLKAKLDTTEQQIQRLDQATITWEELGIDALFLDEFHHYKNLYCPTKMTRVAGLPNTDSQRAFDCFMKVRAVLENGGRVVCATATPVSNTIAEVYICQKYLQLEMLQELGLDHFDAWVQQFAETTQSLEMTPDGSGFRMNTRFNKFTNIPELSQLWQQVLEVKSAAELNLPRPKLAGGKPDIISVPASDELKAYVHDLARRVEAIKGRRVAPHIDNMLKVTSDGRKAALDIRLVRPDAARPAQSKVMALVEQIERLYHETKETRGVQLVFLDISTPKGRSDQL